MMFNAGIIAFPQLDTGPVDPEWANVVSLLHFDGDNNSTTFTDEKGVVWTVFGDAKISTTDPRFGSGCGLFDGSGDYIQSAAGVSGLDVSTGDWTDEGWFKRGSTGGLQAIVGRGDPSAHGSASNLTYAMYFDSDTLVFRVYTGGSFAGVSSGSTITDTDWHHFAMCVGSGTLYAFIDGVLQGTAAGLGTLNTDANRVDIIGGLAPGWGASFNGRVDDRRKTKGVCRYTSNFTPPTEPFPDQ